MTDFDMTFFNQKNDYLEKMEQRIRDSRLEHEIHSLKEQNRRMLEVIERQTATILRLSEHIDVQAEKKLKEKS